MTMMIAKLKLLIWMTMRKIMKNHMKIAIQIATAAFGSGRVKRK
jgi:hypothetical protein